MQWQGDPDPGLWWVFAHGSLMFDPGFEHVGRLPAVVEGWERRFGQPSVRNWGTESAPAPTCSLVPGTSVAGVALGVRPSSASFVLDALTKREARSPMEVEIGIGAVAVVGLTWPMSSTWATLTAEQLADAALHNIRSGGGPSGDAARYLTGVHDVLETVGSVDWVTRGYADALDALLEGRPRSG